MSRMRITLGMVCVLAVILGDRSASAEDRNLEKPALRVGVALPLSGDAAVYGLDIQRGMVMARDEAVTNGVAIDLLPEDTQLQPRLAASAAQKLINHSKVDVIVSLWDTAEPIAPIAERARTPHLSIRWNPRVAEEFSHTFTFESTYITWIREVLVFLRSQGVKRLALLTDMSGLGWMLCRERLLEQAAQYGIEVVQDVQIMSAGDAATAVTKLISTPSDYILVLVLGPSQVEIMRRLQERKVATPITGYFEAMNPPVNIEGRRFVAEFAPERWFTERFKAKFPKHKPMRAAFGYDLIKVLGELVTKLGRRPSSAEILQHFSSLRDYHGATGTLTANATRNIETTCVLQEIRDGEGIVVAQ